MPTFIPRALSLCAIRRCTGSPFVRRPGTAGISTNSVLPLNTSRSTRLPSDFYQLLPVQQKAGDAEDDLFENQVQDVRKWWADERYNGVKRPYSAEDVVSKRGALQQIYPSSLMARKLFNLLSEKAAAGQPLHTREPFPLS